MKIGDDITIASIAWSPIDSGAVYNRFLVGIYWLLIYFSIYLGGGPQWLLPKHPPKFHCFSVLCPPIGFKNAS